MGGCVARSLVPTPDLPVEVVRSDQPGRSYISPWPDGKLVLDSSGNRGEDCGVLLHEIGHLFDWTLLSHTDRGQIGCRVFRSSKPVRWWSYIQTGVFSGGGEGEEQAIEWFAEAYKLAALTKRLPRGRDWAHRMPTSISLAYGLEPVIDRNRLKTLRRIIKRAYAARTADRSERDQRTPIVC